MVQCVFRVVAFMEWSDGLQNIGLVLSFAICLTCDYMVDRLESTVEE